MVSLSKRLMHIRDQDCDDAQPQLSKFEHFALTVCLRVPSAEAVTNGHAGKSQISDERRQGSEIFSDIPVIYVGRDNPQRHKTDATSNNDLLIQ